MNQDLKKYSADFERFEAASPLWLQKTRHRAMSRFIDLGFPTSEWENWRYTSVDPITQKTFCAPPPYRPDGTNPADLDPLGCGALEAIRLVFVNGQFIEKFSHQSEIPGATIGSLSDALRESNPAVKKHLAQYALFSKNPFAALNTSFLSDGAFVSIPQNRNLEKPIQILWYTDSAEDSYLTHPRHLVVLGKGSQASVLESYFGRGIYWTNAVTEVVLEENAVLYHYKLQREDQKAFHISTIQANEGRGSHFTSVSLSLGGRIARNEISSLLNDEGAECTLNGLFLTQGEQHVDHHTLIDHAKPHGTSLELYKGILDGKSTGVFDGSIVVRPHATQTNARQTNRNLLLSDDALVNTRPLLEIYNDDVKCNHGATIGRLDETQLFYLRSRGIEHREARTLLTAAFAHEVIYQIKLDPLKAYLDHEIHARLMNRSGEGASR